MKVREAIAAAAERLASYSESPRLDAELLMAEALGTERESLLLSGQNIQAPAAFDALVARRECNEPIAYIIGRRAFWTIELQVGPGVLVPRPDSETLLEAAVDHFGMDRPNSILDLGTGSGALLLAALDQWPKARGVGVDRSIVALSVASANAERLGLAKRAEFRLGDWGTGLEERFDLILCNPPYVDAAAELAPDVRNWEPPEALFAGDEGLAEYRRLAPQIGPLLSERGKACIEVGAGQAEAVEALFDSEGLKIARRCDLGGHIRCLIVGY